MEAIEVASGKKAEYAAEDAAKQREVIRVIETEKDQAVLEKELREKMAGGKKRSAKRDGDLAAYFGVVRIFSEL